MKIKAKSIFTVIIITTVLFVLAACTGLTPGPTGEEKAVPVYQGMVVSETLSTLSANDSINPNIMRLSNIGVTRNLNTNPIDQDDPFGTLDEGTISEVVTTEFPVTQTEVADYYSEINKDIFITVKLSNPDNFVILSFTLNGVFYQSYQFQDGSDSENLILKVNTGTTSGIKEYTIDAIKYIDGTEIKDVIFAGERTITVGLKHNSEPSVLVSDEVVNATSILLTVNLSDSQSLSILNKIVLYDGESLVQIYDLSLGENNIVFDKLNINTLYQYAVISVYDLIDGNNSRLSLLEKKALYTDDIVSVDNVVPTQTSIGFGITVTDVDQVGAVSAIELYKGETLVEALTDLSVREFTGLLSNNEYTIKVTYTYDLNDGVGAQTLTINQAATTLAKATPTVVIDNVVPTQTSIGFGITVTDVDQVGAVSAIELYKGETLVEALTDLSVREFTGLLSNNEYTVKVTYTYDLNDGVGAQTLTINQAATTLAKATPTVVIDNVVPTQTSIGFGITVTDVDQVGAVSAIELYKGETLVEALTDLSVREFTGLLSNTEYTIKVSYIYDLNDGQGNHNLKVRTYNYLIADKFQDSNQSEGYVWGLIHAKIDSNKSIYLINPLTGNLNINIKVYFEDITIQEFNTLGYGDKIIVYGTFINGYVLGVFNTVEKRDTIDNVKTKEKQTPSAVIDNVVPTQESISFGITVTDADEVGSITAIELYQGETLIESISDLTLREFTGLLSNNEYTIKVTYTYDLNDGVGEQSLVISKDIKTLEKATPVVLIENIVPTQDSITFEINVTDVDQVGSITAIELYKGETLVEALTDLDLRTFTNLLSNNEYQVKVTYTYDLNDGIEDQFLNIDKAITTIKLLPIVGFDIVNIDRNNVSYTINIDDNDKSLINIHNIRAIIIQPKSYPYEQERQEIIDLGIDLAGYINNIDSGNTHTIEVIVLVDLNDGLGLTEKTFVHYFNTIMMEISFDLNSSVITQNSLTFNLWEIDLNLAGRTNLNFTLYNDGLTENISNEFDESPEMLYGWILEYEHTFYNLLSNSKYILVIEFFTDLDDGLGERKFTHQIELQTKAKVTPEVVIDNVVPTQTSVGFGITVTDVDQVGAVSAIELYQGETLVEELPDLSLRTFSDLLSNNEYQIKVTYTYDLNGGQGEQHLTVQDTITTIAKATPEVVISNIVPTQDSATFDITVTDMDEVGNITAIELYQGETLVEALTDLGVREFSDLLSNNEYTLKVTFTYDLNDGSNPNTLFVEERVETLLLGLNIFMDDTQVIVLNYEGPLKELILPDFIMGIPITTIAEGAFKDNGTIQSISLGQYVYSIGDNAFRNMTHLEKIEFPNSATNFGTNVLYQSNNLEFMIISSEASFELRYYFGNNVNFIPSSLRVIKYANGANYINKKLFNNNMGNVSTIVLADDWKHIFEGQFESSQHIKEVVLPEGLVSVGRGAFQESSIEVIHIPENVIIMNDLAFANAKKLHTITFDNNGSLETIGNSVFHGAISLESIEIPPTVTSIGFYAFAYANSLKSIYIPTSVLQIGTWAFFENHPLVILTEHKEAPNGWVTSWNPHNRLVIWGYLETIDDDNIIYATSSNNTVIILGLSASAEENMELIIPGHINNMEVIQISPNAFKNEHRLTSIQIPNSIVEISPHTFAYAVNLQTVIFEENSQLQVIGEYAFSYTSSLQEIVIPITVTIIDQLAFYSSGIQIIRVEANEKPNGWDDLWNYLGSSYGWFVVEWGYKD